MISTRRIGSWLTATTVAAAALALPAFADDDDGKRRRKRTQRGRLDEQAMLERFDADGDGTLSPEERRDAQQTLAAERQEQAYLELFDEDGDGELSDEEIRAARAEVNRLAEEITQRIEGQLDTDGDGELDGNELRAVLAQTEKKKNAAKDMYRELAKEYDKDGDGQLSDEEKAALRKAVAEKQRGERMREMPGDGAMPGAPGAGMREEILRRFDKDGDGRLGPQERKAAAAAMRERLGGENGPMDRAEMLKKYDKDGDGTLSPRERRRAFAELAKTEPAKKKKARKQGPNDWRKGNSQAFDVDGDGRVSLLEAEAGRYAYEELMRRARVAAVDVPASKTDETPAPETMPADPAPAPEKKPVRAGPFEE